MNYEDKDNKPIAYRLGVTAMATFLFYRGAAGEVEQSSCGPKRAAMLREKIEVMWRAIVLWRSGISARFCTIRKVGSVEMEIFLFPSSIEFSCRQIEFMLRVAIIQAKSCSPLE